MKRKLKLIIPYFVGYALAISLVLWWVTTNNYSQAIMYFTSVFVAFMIIVGILSFYKALRGKG